MVNFSRQSNNAIVKWWWTIDKIILFVSLALLAIGIILDITASPAVARKIGSDDYFFIRKQIVYVLLSIGCIFTLSLFKLKTVRRISILGFAGLMVLLVITDLWGFEVKGARRWISLPGMSLQPSELLKPIFINLST